MARPTPVINPTVHRRLLTGGFTLAECLIASVVLAITVLGICSALTAASHQTEAMEVDACCLSLARQMMEEIASRGFDPPASQDQSGWAAGNTTTSVYDDIADFDGVDQQVAAAPNPERLTDTISFQRQVAVQFRATASGAANPTGDFAMISVTVTPSSHGDPVTLHRLAARYKTIRE